MTRRDDDPWWTEHLVETPREWRLEKAELFGMSPDMRVNESVPICELRRLLKKLLGREWIEITPIGPPQPELILEQLPVLRDLEPLVHAVTARSIDHLKELAGIPNETILAAERRTPRSPGSFSQAGRDSGEDTSGPSATVDCGSSRMTPRHVEFRHLPLTPQIVWEELTPDERTAVHSQAYNLVFGYADTQVIKERPIAAVADYVLERSRKLPIFTAKDLIVCDEEQVVFSGFSGLWFDNVIIEGSGQITLGQFTKLHCYNIKRVPFN